MRDVSGEFETHLTVRTHSDADLAGCPELAARLGLRFVHIVLEHGVVPAQPMFTGRGRGDLAGHRIRTAGWADHLRAHGFEVIDVEEEYVIDDDNLALDTGWLDPAVPA